MTVMISRTRTIWQTEFLETICVDVTLDPAGYVSLGMFVVLRDVFHLSSQRYV